MKRTFLILLLAGTLGIASTLMVYRATLRPSPNLSAANQIQSNRAISANSHQPSERTPQSTTPPTPWAAIESSDPTQLIQNLRAVGCPEKTLQDLVVFRKYREYQAEVLASRRQQALETGFHRNNNSRDWNERYSKKAHAQDTRGFELESLLGVNATELEARVFGRPDVWDHEEFLPLKKRIRLAEVNTRYAQALRTLHSGTPAAESRMAELNRQKRAEIEAILSPLELAEFDKRYHTSPASRYVINRLPEALSEADFIKMVKAVEAAGLALPPASSMAARYGLVAPDEAADAAQARKEALLETRLKEVLGAARWAQMRQAEEEWNRRQSESGEADRLNRNRTCFGLRADLMGLKRNDALQFYDQLMDLKPALRAKYAALEQALPGTPEEKRNQARAALRAELTQRASALNPDKGPALMNRELDSGNSFNDLLQ